MGQIKVDDIYSFECTSKFGYKNCEVDIRRLGNIVDIRIIHVNKNGYMIERNKTYRNKSGHKYLLDFLNDNINYIEDMYKSVIKDNNIIDFNE